MFTLRGGFKDVAAQMNNNFKRYVNPEHIKVGNDLQLKRAQSVNNETLSEIESTKVKIENK